MNINILEIVGKIKELPFYTETTIAELINYNPEKNFIEPIIQGQMFNNIKDVCRKENIYIERCNDEKGGLAFYSKFKKTNLNIPDEFKINNNIIF